MAAEGMQLPWRWNGSTISLNLGVTWEMSAEIYTDGTYKALNPTWGQEDSPWKASQILPLLRAHGIEPTTVAEIGCGAGGVLASVVEGLSSVTEAEGWDVSPHAIELAQRNVNDRLRFVVGDMLATNREYELCLCIDVFEHTPDYLGFLRALRKRAQHFVFHIPLDMHCSAIMRDRHLSVRKSVGHLHYFSRATALATLADCGYKISAERYTNGAMARLGGHRGWKTDMVNILRMLFSDGLSAKMFGGYSLLVLASRE